MSNLLSNRCMRHALFTNRQGDNPESRFLRLTEQCPLVLILLSSTTLLRLGFLSQMAEVCQELSTNGKLCHRSSSQILGTWGILYNCCFTLSLCVVTAIHMNVGPAGENNVQWFCRKGKWVAIAILAPEIMLYTAGKQWFSASRLSKKLNKFAVEEQPEMLRTDTVTTFWSESETPARAVHD